MLLVECLSKTHTSSIAIYVSSFISNSLFCICVAAALYCAWWQHKPLVIPMLITAMLFVTGMLLKYIIAAVHMPSCCLGFVLTHYYSLPSLHAAIATFLAIYYTKPLIQQLYPALPIVDPEKQEVAVTKMSERECYVRIGTIFIYAIAICYSRMHLTLNTFVDVFIGILIGLVYAGLELKISPELQSRLFKIE